MNGRDLVLAFCQKRKEAKGTDFLPNFGRDGKMLLRAVEAFGEEETLTRMDAYFMDEDDWLYKIGYNVPGFLDRINTYDPKMANTYRARAESMKQRKKLVENPQRVSDIQVGSDVKLVIDGLAKKWSAK